MAKKIFEKVQNKSVHISLLMDYDTI